MSPKQNAMTYTDSYWSPLGRILLASNGTELTGLWFEGQKYFGSSLQNRYEQKNLPILKETKRWLDLYFCGSVPDFTPPLSMETTPFRKSVWELLRTIPYGQTCTYKEIALKLAAQRGLQQLSAQAVGNAVGHNAISLIIPCHRVIGADGNLTGYAGGIDKKIQLLTLEHADLSSFSLSKQKKKAQ